MKVWILFLALISAAVPSIAGPPQTSITVSVKNQQDKPIDNATVILDFLGSHQYTKLGKRKPIHWEMHTNQEGLAKFPPVPQGTIQVQVVAKDYQTTGKRYEVESKEKRVDITLNPPQPQYSAHPPLKPSDTTKQ